MRPASSIAAQTQMETASGHYFDFAAPEACHVDVEDIAQALSLTCRFGGHIGVFYSVAEHALLVRRLVIRAGRPDLALAALHHDSHEAYVGDIPTPLKRAIGQPYRVMVARIDGAIAEALGLNLAEVDCEVVHAADAQALRLEAAALKRSRGIEGAWPWRELPEPLANFAPGLSPDAARRAFLAAHEAGA